MKTPSPVVPDRQTLQRHYHARRPEAARHAGCLDHKKELHGGHVIAPNYRNDFTFRGARIIITGSLIGRYEKDGHLPLVQNGYRLLKGSVVDSLLIKLRSL